MPGRDAHACRSRSTTTCRRWTTPARRDLRCCCWSSRSRCWRSTYALQRRLLGVVAADAVERVREVVPRAGPRSRATCSCPPEAASRHRPVRPVGPRQDDDPALPGRAGAARRGARSASARRSGSTPSAASTCRRSERQVGYLFQEYALFPHLTVSRATSATGSAGCRGRARASASPRLLRFVRLADLERALARASCRAAQQQRVALARALAPRAAAAAARRAALGARRPDARASCAPSCAGCSRRCGVPALFVTHDRIEALALADRIAVLAGGGDPAGRAPSPRSSAGPPTARSPASWASRRWCRGRVVGSPGRGDVERPVESAGSCCRRSIPGTSDAECFVCIRAEEVMLERGAIGQVSARNRLPGHVVGDLPDGPLLRVGARLRLPAGGAGDAPGGRGAGPADRRRRLRDREEPGGPPDRARAPLIKTLYARFTR